MEGECSNQGDCEISGVELAWKRVNVGGKLPPRDGHCACSCGGKIFIFGGVVQTSGEGQHRESNDLLMFDPGKSITASMMAKLRNENLGKTTYRGLLRFH